MAEVPLIATYRLQLTQTFGLEQAALVVPYLAGLGISHVYTSSYLQAAPGSSHGYDVVDPSSVNLELGGDDALALFFGALEHHGLTNVIDVVPNHLGVGSHHNQWWWNTLKHGQHCAAAQYFDIDWTPPEAKLQGRVLLAVLGSSYADELAGGAITFAATEGLDAEIHYGARRFPVDPDSPALIDGAHDSGRFTDPANLHELLEQQHYRLAAWTVGRFELNYRRFFEINDLAGIRIEDETVFAAVHQRSLRWVEQGHVQGIRIDHPDGLRDPGHYLRRLRAAAPTAWIVVEKILAADETLPDDWPVDGTTGYDFASDLTAVFVDSDAADAMTDTYSEFTGNTEPYSVVLDRCKHMVVHQLLATEVTRLVQLAAGICERSIALRDTARRTLSDAIEAILVATPVYRTYVANGRNTSIDLSVISGTIARAKSARPTIDPELFDFLATVWSGRHVDPETDQFVARLQQLSGTAMAKGAEDTAFYRYHRLIALNEVGSNPSRFGIRVDQFHNSMIEAVERRPLSMIATTTHDTKRSEDVRARIALLSEIPEQWRSAVTTWRQHNRPAWGTAEPDRQFEYLLYQTLVGAHPLPVERAVEFASKAIREAKLRTSWIRPDSNYEASIESFVRRLDADPRFQQMLAEFVAPLIQPTRISSLAQVLIKATAPGIPDFYQGSELWTASLVDPDNRTPVYFEVRGEILRRNVESLEHTNEGGLSIAEDATGRWKLATIRAALAARRHEPSAFTGPTASYEPLQLTGTRPDVGLAFMRGQRFVTVAPVRPVAVSRNGWGDTQVTLPPGLWCDAIRRGPEWMGSVSVAELTADRHVVLLVKKALLVKRALLVNGASE